MPTAPAVAGSPTTALDSTSATTTLTIAKPAGAAVGDLLVAQLAGRQSSVTWTGPGWTVINNVGTTSIGATTLYRVVDGTEGSSFTFTVSALCRLAGGIVRITGADPVTPIDVKSTNTGLAATNLDALSVTPATADTDSLLLAFHAVGNGTGTITVPSGMTQLWSFVALVTAAAPDVAASWLTLASNAATGNKTATVSVAGNYCAQLVVIQPPGVASISDAGWGIHL